MQPTRFAPYGHCVAYPPDSDRMMFRCNDEKKAWYLERGLAVVVSEDPPIIRLTFQPRGPGHDGDPYFLQQFQNRCVVCGTMKELSHHHIVPYGYRRYWDRGSEETGRWMYDVLLLCIYCHDHYERRAHELKEEIAKEYGVPSSGISNIGPTEVRVIKCASALYRHRDKLPEERKKEFEETVRTYLKKDTLISEDLLIWKKLVKSIEVVPAGLAISAKIKDVDEFAIRWRRHFMKCTKPRFLPDGWDPERRIYSEPDQTEGWVPVGTTQK